MERWLTALENFYIQKNFYLGGYLSSCVQCCSSNGWCQWLHMLNIYRHDSPIYMQFRSFAYMAYMWNLIAIFASGTYIPIYYAFTGLTTNYLVWVTFKIRQLGQNSLLIYRDLFVCDVIWHYDIIGMRVLMGTCRISPSFDAKIKNALDWSIMGQIGQNKKHKDLFLSNFQPHIHHQVDLCPKLGN